MSCKLVPFTILYLCILYTMAIKTQIELTIPTICNKKKLSVDLQVTNVFGEVRGIYDTDIRDPADPAVNQKTNLDLFDIILANKGNIVLTIPRGRITIIKPTNVQNELGEIISFGFDVLFKELPYPTVQLKAIDDTSPEGYFNYLTSQVIFHSTTENAIDLDKFATEIEKYERGCYLHKDKKAEGEALKTAYISTPKTDDTAGGFFLVVAIHRRARLTLPPPGNGLYDGYCNQQKSIFDLYEHQDNLETTIPFIEKLEKLKFVYDCDLTLAIPSMIPIVFLGPRTEPYDDGFVCIQLSFKRFDLLSYGVHRIDGLIRNSGFKTIEFVAKFDRMSDKTSLLGDMKKTNLFWHIYLDGGIMIWVKNPVIIENDPEGDFIMKFDKVI